MNKDEALKMAIEWFDKAEMDISHHAYKNALPIIQACKEALEQPLTRDWKHTIDERIARDSEFKEALEQPAQKPLSDAATKDLQQRLALKDFEIMRLREALHEVKYADDSAYYVCEKIAEQALATPATYDDLMAWHNEQLGEPVAWMNDAGFCYAEWKSDLDEYYGKPIPLYAKKG
jgi:hypothetical protein